MKDKKFWLAVFILLVAGWSSLAAQQAEPKKMELTLDDCLRLALEQNPFYLSTLEKEGQARAQVRQAVSNFFPNVSAQGTDILDKKSFYSRNPPHGARAVTTESKV